MGLIKFLTLVLLTWSGLASALDTVRPAHGEPEAPKDYIHPEMLTETDQLAKLLNGKQATPPILIDARGKDEFLTLHLPGARNIESDTLQDPERKPYFLPPPEAIAALFVQNGIDAETPVIIYDNHGGRLAARVWFVLWAHGHNKVSLLNGGYGKWRLEKRALEPGNALPVKEGTFKALEKPRGLATLGDLKMFRELAQTPTGTIPPTTLLDARDYAEYSGQDVRSKAAGHIPGAVNVAWDNVLRPLVASQADVAGTVTAVWKEAPEIHALLRAACVVPNCPLGVYDQSGGRAAHLLFTLRLLGYEQSVCYYGGWREYGNAPGVEIEK